MAVRIRILYQFFYPFHFKDGLIKFPADNNKKQYLLCDKKGLLQVNRNYLFLKRFTSKEEKRRLQPAIYLKKSFKQFDYISTDNKLNFIDTLNDNDNLSLSEIFGLYALFNSTVYDKYYRILDGGTQVNAGEINSMPVPGRQLINQLGDKLRCSGDLSTEFCDNLIEEVV